jgi:hypothetical protein
LGKEKKRREKKRKEKKRKKEKVWVDSFRLACTFVLSGVVPRRTL